MNQLVQVILANGQVVTTTLAALQQQQQLQLQPQQQSAAAGAAAAAVQQFVHQQQQHQQQQQDQLSPQQIQTHNQQVSPHAQLFANTGTNQQQCHVMTAFGQQALVAQAPGPQTTAQLVFNPATGQTQVLQFATFQQPQQQQQDQNQQSQQIVIPTMNSPQFINQSVMLQQQQQQQQQLNQFIKQEAINGKINVQQQQQVHQQQGTQLAAQIVQLVSPMGGGTSTTQVLVNPATGQILGQLAPAPASFSLSTMPMMSALSTGQIMTQGMQLQAQQAPHQALTGQLVSVVGQPQPQQQQQSSQVQNSLQSQQPAQNVVTDDATRLHVQRVIQQQKQQILQQQQAHQQNHGHRQAHVSVLIEQRNRNQALEQGKGGMTLVKVVSPQGRVVSSSTGLLSSSGARSQSKQQPPLIAPAATLIPSQTKSTSTSAPTAFHIVTNPVVEQRTCVTIRETVLSDPGVDEAAATATDAGDNDVDRSVTGVMHSDADDNSADVDDGESCQTSLSSTPSSCSRMEPESTTHSDSSSQATIAHTINTTSARIIDGVDLQDVQEFARNFKMRRQQLGMTQTQVGHALAQSQGPTYSQSAICRFEKLEISPKSALKIMPVLKEWMADAEKQYQSGQLTMTDIVGSDSNKKRKRRTTFSTQATEHLSSFFAEVTQHPNSEQMSELADKLNYDREVIRVWFCNRRQALKKVLTKNSVSSSLKLAA